MIPGTPHRSTLIAAAALAIVAAMPSAASAQTGGATGLPTGPTPRSYSPEQLGAVSSSGRYLISSTANDKGAFLWVVDTIDRKVTLCEKPAGSADFTCSKKGTPIP
jgi:hypothetical protein